MTGVSWLSHADTGGLPDAYARYLSGEPVGVLDVARRCPDTDALAAFASSRLGATLDDALAAELADRADRLGGTDATARAIEAVRAGRAVLVFAGQQPGLLAGPLYTLHKAATAVAVARALGARGIAAYPAFWIAADDADLDETGIAYAPGPDRGLRKVQLRGTYGAGTLAGDVPSAESADAFPSLFPDAGDALRALVAACTSEANDTGEFLAVLLLRLFGHEGLVPVDSRLPALRRAAEPLVRRYVEVHADVAARVDAAGDALEARGEARPIHETSAASALFAIDAEGRRTKLDSPEDARALDALRLSAGVVLRPFVQEAVFPTGGMVVGPGELAYLEQTEPASEILGVRRSPFVPRLTATWVDADLEELATLADGGWAELFADPSRAVDARLRREVAPELLRAIERLREGNAGGFAEIARIAEADGDKGLAQISEAARKKADYQIGRVESHVMDRTRKAAGRDGVVLSNVAEFLRPRAAAQERTFSALWPLGELAPAALAATAVTLACEHLARVSRRDAAHVLISFEAARARAEEESCGERCV